MIDKSFPFDKFREDVENALQDVSKKYNVQIEPGNIKYSDIEFKLTLNVTEKVNGAEDAGQATWTYYCKYYGFKVADFNKIVKIEGKQYKITGIQHHSKYAVVTQCLNNGKTVCWRAEIVKKALEDIER